MKKKLLAFCLAMTMMLSTSALVFAADTNTATADGTVNTQVSTKSTGADGSAESAFLVQVPANMELTRDTTDPTKFVTTYEIGVKGVLASGKYVTVVPSATFEMTGKTNTNEKRTATVTQAKTKVLDADKTAGDDSVIIGFDEFAKLPGSISVNIKKADVYTGQLGFTVKLN